ncbi:MAG: hypothetical protein HKN51_14890 [Saprospiraceae bacterium]|nr:hypothetical protein [Saprospiraceae bacterium]
MKRKTLHITLLFFLFSQALNGQTLNAFLNAAEEALAEKDYYNAAYYYKTAIEFDTTDLNNRYAYADASLMFNAYAAAERAFQRVVDNDSEKAFALAPYKLAEAQHKMGKYEAAKRNYQLYISENEGDNSALISEAEKAINAINWAVDNGDPIDGVTISNLGGSVNTPYSEYNAIRSNDKIYYASHRFEFEEEDRKINRIFSKVLSKEGENEAALIDSSFNSSGAHVSNLAFNKDATKVFYTICEYENAFDIVCDIYSRNINDDGSWSSPMKLPDYINDSLATNTQPSVGYDADLDKEILYFVSDRIGGSGGLDIYYALIEDSEIGKPVNLKSVNTDLDEITPFFHSPTSTLYFSTNNRLGMGGFDVFKSRKDKSRYAPPVNIGAPQNTSYDDIYYTLNEEGTEGLFSSNRLGSAYLDDGFEACCFDIYKADIEEVFIDLKILTFNEVTRDPLPGANVQIIDPITGEIIFNSTVPNSNEHLFTLKRDRAYIIVTEKEGYQRDEISLIPSQFGELEIVKKIYLKPLRVKLEVFTFDALTKLSLNGTRITLRDLDNPKDNSLTELDRSGNYYTFDIIAGGKYELIASKRGYETVTQIVNTNRIFNGVITEKIYLKKKVFSLNEYLPVVVYFDNDRPDRRSLKMYTDLNYSQTYGPYYSRKNEFIKNYTETLEGDDKLFGRKDINAFFENEVKAGYDKLVLFIRKLKERLDAGDELELSLKGFASPRAASKYNLALGQRRVWTLKNELRTFDNNALQGYIKSGQLKITEISFGEEISPTTISDAYSNPRLSVYSIEASRERKAEIVRIKILN